MSSSTPTSHPDPRWRPAAPSPHAATFDDAGDGLRLSDYRDILFDYRRLVVGIIAMLLAIGIAYAVLASPVYRGNLLIQIEESEPDAKVFLNETSGLFEVKTFATGEIQVLGSRLVLGAAVDQAALRVQAQPRYVPVVGAWLARSATGLSTPGFLGLGGYVSGTEHIDVDRFVVPASFDNTRPFLVTALADGEFTVRHQRLQAPLQGRVGQALRVQLPEGDFDIEISRLDGLPGAEFTVWSYSRASAIEQLQARLQLLEQGRQSNVISVVVEDEDPARLARSLKAISDRYVMHNTERKSAEAQKTLAFLESQLPIFERQLQVSEEALSRFRSINGTSAFDEETRVWLRQTTVLQTSLLELQQRRRAAEITFTDQSPQLVTLDRQIGAVQREQKALSSRIANLPGVERDALRLERDVKVNSDLYQSMRNNALQMRLLKEGRSGSIRLLDRAEVPETPVRPQRLLIIALALTLGLFAGPAVAIMCARVRSGIRHPDELEASTGLDVRAVVPFGPEQAASRAVDAAGPPGDRLLADTHPRSRTVEALRSLRMALPANAADTPGRRIAVLGASAGAGATFIAGNLALLLAQSGHRVLLIDADLRHGGIGPAFGLHGVAGLSDLLSGRVGEVDAVQVAVRPHLDVLAVGTLPDLAADLLESTAFAGLLDRFSARYDHVILDAAPVLVSADATGAARACGTALLVARAGQSQPGELNESVRRLQQAGVCVDGVVLNGVDLGERYGSRYIHRHRGIRAA